LPSNNYFAWQNTSDTTLEFVLENIQKEDFTTNLQAIVELPSSTTQNNLFILNELLLYEREKNKNYFLSKLKDQNSTEKLDIILNTLIKGYLEFYYNTEKPKSFEYFYEAYLLSKEYKNQALLKISLLAILKLYSNGVLQNTNNFLKYLFEYKRLVSSPEDALSFYNMSVMLIGMSTLYDADMDLSTIDYLKELDSLEQFFPRSNHLHIKYLYTRGSFFFVRREFDDALNEYLKINQDQQNISFQKAILFNTYLKLAHIYLNKDLSKVPYYFKQAEHITNDTLTTKNQFALTWYKAEYYEKIKDSAKAYKYIKETNALRYQLNFLKSNEIITETEIENRTKEKEVENRELKQKNQQQLILIIVIITILVLTSGVGYLAFTNSRKKRLLALQEKELERQKNLTLLKEQEISTINAMVEGQEKERKRVAEDLHDNLGSVIATLKLHFENLRMNREKKKINQEVLFDKTENLIDEAYQKVRSIAHAKNSGVIANDGLLVAVKLMAEKISSANKVLIEVIDYGLEKPIENSLEISLFRIIQELTTNIIKHSGASMATINISQDQDDITILIEDNGKGMDTSQINLKKGMGLHSIKTRVEHLEGSFTIDSTPTKGTTIIINIPT
jgi:signal transduction histidine kinase